MLEVDLRPHHLGLEGLQTGPHTIIMEVDHWSLEANHMEGFLTRPHHLGVAMMQLVPAPQHLELEVTCKSAHKEVGQVSHQLDGRISTTMHCHHNPIQVYNIYNHMMMTCLLVCCISLHALIARQWSAPSNTTRREQQGYVPVVFYCTVKYTASVLQVIVIILIPSRVMKKTKQVK